MRIFLFGSLLWIIGVRPAAGEAYFFKAGPTDIRYKVSANQIVATVRHPFRVVRFETHAMTGHCTFDPGSTFSGLEYAFEVPLKNFDSPDGALGSAVVRMLGGAPISISGSSIVLVKGTKAPGDAIIAVIRPKLVIAGKVSYPEVNVRITLDGKVWHWQFRAEFSLTEFKIPVPRMWGIPAEDRVVLAGEVSFSPKD